MGGSDRPQEIATRLETSAAAALQHNLPFTIDLDPHGPKELGGKQHGVRTISVASGLRCRPLAAAAALVICL